MSNIILKAENISKQYRLGLIGTGTISHDLNRWWSKIRGKEDPYLKVGAVNDRSSKATEDYVWALKDINFEVKRGEVLGIIGKNGAGKSTLLKILSRVTSPTTGSIKTKGRIASLLEVGTGFHPELTGRENIYLNGAILGMSKSEIHSKIDEIVEFSGCEMYIDTPTKRYSSGMTVRLAFAVAAFLEPDILVVDEVLAVGDAEFQKKAIGKMQDISQGEGRTVLFVSHNMAVVQKLCGRVILLENGAIKEVGDCVEVVASYLKKASLLSNIFSDTTEEDEVNKIRKIEVITSNKSFFQDQLSQLTIIFELKIVNRINDAALSFQIVDTLETPLVHLLILSKDQDFGKTTGTVMLKAIIPELALYPGIYTINAFLADNTIKKTYSRLIQVCGFEVVKTESRDYYWKKGSAIYNEKNTSWEIA
ncbi:ABC transporter ATP-binding protein [Nonlabens marinus]|uniref:ABC transporter, ATP-binding protein n=1 Tax=Nonlabens marinus S1-08 TaxID=1454201 RepID=W8VQL3_9FLAO|nr:ABC transporter ATP-binding protein [Nonlabens marinus]BAO55729.1 ABC transporter, ATP-binding protein [Nonlabens marinus S1-08]